MQPSQKRRRTTQSEETTPDNAYCFNTGDVRILVTVKGDRLEGRVSANSLCLASPVWHKFLFPPWDTDTPAADDDVKQIDFTEDDSNALLILLNICHLRFKKIPS